MNPAGETTLGDLLLTLAVRMGWHKKASGSDNRALVPTDPETYRRLLEAINNGRREVYRRMPTARCFKPRLAITTTTSTTDPQVVDGDTAKYRLPYAVQALAGGDWTWSQTSTPGFGGQLPQKHHSDIAALHQTANASGLLQAPRCMAFGFKTTTSPEEPGRRTQTFLWIWPKPDQAYTLEGQVRIMYAPLTERDDLEPMGQQHVDTILTAAARDLKINHPDLNVKGASEADLDKAIAISLELDNQAGPQTIGPGFDPQAVTRRRRSGDTWPASPMVSTYNGVPLNP